MADIARRREIQTLVRQGFAIFDKSNSRSILIEEVGSLLRYLGQFPTESDLVNSILKDMQSFDIGSNIIRYETFEPVAVNAILNNLYPPDDSDTLLMAFRALDPENRGYVEVSKLKELLGSAQVPMKSSELNSFLEVGKRLDESDKFFYEDYVAKFTDSVDAHLANLYY